jgi:hypothetical protein
MRAIRSPPPRSKIHTYHKKVARAGVRDVSSGIQEVGASLGAADDARADGACGGRPEEPERRPLPEEEGQALRPGEYRSEEFEPSLSFSVGEGWATYTPETQDVLRLAREETGGLGFTNIREVYEPNRTGSPDVAEAPEDIVGWFRRHPYVQTTEPEPATVGGVEGVRFDAVVGDYLSVPRIRDKNTTLLSTESRTKRRSSC